MKNWELARSQRLELPVERRPEVGDFICLSRQVGIDARPIAEAIADRLGWPFFDRELLDRMAGDDEVRRALYESVDERDFKWWEAAMSPWVTGRNVVDDYFHRLCDTVLMLARQGNGLFLGRGAELILPAASGLRILLAASLDRRVAAVAAARDLKPAAARQAIAAEEQGREEFFRHHFRAVPHQPYRFDLVIDLDRWSEAEVVELALAAHRIRGARPAPPPQ